MHCGSGAGEGVLPEANGDGVMHAIMLNGAAASEKDRVLLAKALSTPGRVTESGGYLFKCRMDREAFHLGIVPNFLNGQRTYHYDIDIGLSEFNLIGAINANGSLTVVFKPDQAKVGQPFSEADVEAYRRQYRSLARFLVECGLPPSFPLDAITSEVLQEAGLCERTVTTIGQLAGLPENPPAAPPESL